MLKGWTLLATLIGAILLAILATTPPGPRAADTPTGDFSAGRAMSDVIIIGRAPHPSGSADNIRVRSYLIARLQRLGLDVRTTATPASDIAVQRLRSWAGNPNLPAPTITNIVATLPGRDRASPAVAIMAHYDSVWASPGAADDSAGVASALEIARAIRAGPQPARDLMLVLTDGEELGLEGGHAFVEHDPEHGHVGVFVNLETRGGGGRAAMFETGAHNGAMMRLFVHAVRGPSTTSLSVFVYKHLPNSTDLTPALAMGYPGFNFAFIGRPALYHSPLATPDRLDQGALQDMGAQALDLVRALLTAPALPARAHDATFFDVFGLFTVIYPSWCGWLVLGAAAGLYGYAGWRRRTRWIDVLVGVGTTLVLGGVAGLLLFAVNLVSGAGGPVNYYDRLAAIPRLEVQALLVCIASLVGGVALFRGDDRHAGRRIVGIVAPLLVLGVVAQILAAPAAFIIAVPLLLGAIGAAVAARWPEALAVDSAVAAALGVGYLLGFTFFLLEGVGPGMPFVAALPLMLGAALLWPLLPQLTRRQGFVGAGVLLVLAVGVSLWVRLDAVAASVPPYSYFA